MTGAREAVRDLVFNPPPVLPPLAPLAVPYELPWHHLAGAQAQGHRLVLAFADRSSVVVIGVATLLREFAAATRTG